MATKEQWPELVGKTGDEAAAAVKADRPDVTVDVMNENSACTMDYRVDRVRIFVNAEKRVISPPQTGWTRPVIVGHWITRCSWTATVVPREIINVI